MSIVADTPRPLTAVAPSVPARFALLGNPNAGKTTLFNRLCGIRAKTANFPGSTVEARVGKYVYRDQHYHITDLPGVYGLDLNLPESILCREFLQGRLSRRNAPEALLIVADATNLARNLVFAAGALAQRLPTVVALNMIDLAQRRGLSIDTQTLSRRLGCPVVAVNARSGEGIKQLRQAMAGAAISTAQLPGADQPETPVDWANRIAAECLGRESIAPGRGRSVTDRLDAVFTHPVLGLITFVAVMAGLFLTIFSLATVPMGLIDLILGSLGGWLATVMGPGAVQELVVDGILAGVAGTVVFLPQICLLFFLISLLEDTGYLARAAFVMDRLLRRFGLPGQAFVPLLSAHACAIPAIMSTKLIPDRRDRIVTVLIAPLLSCSARLPVYVLLIGVLFRGNALAAGLAFSACYGIGAIAALFTALLFRRTLLRGAIRPMVLELPSYKLPSLRNAVLTTFDRGVVFLRSAGTVIMAICIILWWLSSYPATNPPVEATALRAEAQLLVEVDPEAAGELEAQAGTITARHALAQSFLGRIGHTVAPVFKPLGYDWQLTVGVLSSFAAREVFVSTMAVIFAAGDQTDDPRVLRRIETAVRDDATPVFTTATAASLLIFYVLAMQCLPTLPVTRRATGSWGWAALQFGYMTALAYVAAFGVYTVLRMFGVT
ncbi:MAG: ferrous iron transporter B [Planctomycetes bacterium]|nr:ferrous iron transporter B [Planctomycetota bacterium]